MVLLALFLACGSDKSPSLYRPEETKDFLSDDLLGKFEDFGLPIYYGEYTSDISGTYLFKEPNIIYNNSDTWPNANNSWCEFYFTFNNIGTSKYTLDAEGITCNASSSGQEYYISGADSCFTLYGSSSGSFEGCAYESVRLISSCVSGEGDLSNPIMGRTNTTVEDSSSCDSVISAGGTLNQGEMAIYSFEGDVAEKQ